MMCTGIKISSLADNTYWGRTQEFNIILNYSGLLIPRSYENNHALTHYRSKYAALGVACNGMPLLIDGVNEKGLAGGSFYFANYNQYAKQEMIKKEGKLALCGEEFVTYALLNYASVAELKELVNKDTAIADATGLFGDSLPQHYVFQDTTGASVVVEPSVAGRYEVYDNPIGIFTNNPKFDWHLVNLQNYIRLDDQVPINIQMDAFTILSPGKGIGLFGIPGDYSPPSRFIRAAYLKHFANPVSDDKAIELIFHLLDSFDIAKGVVKIKGADNVQYTQYTSAYDLNERTLYIHLYDNRMIQTVKLDPTLLENDKLQFYQLVETQQYHQMLKTE